MDDVRLNPQGLSRREKVLMSCLKPEAGNVLVSADLASGEPTVTSHYSKDKRYTYASFTGKGERPYYDEYGILMLDDVYLMGASVSPTGSAKIREIFSSSFGGISFADQWVIDSDVIKSDPNVKEVRSFHKTLMLALQYGQGPQGMVINAHDNGLSLSSKDAMKFHKAYWHSLFPSIRQLGERLQQMRKANGFIENAFGYRLYPDHRKCLNYFIQSTVSGIIDVLMLKFYSVFPDALHGMVIHDELVFEVPESRIAEAKTAWDQAVKSLNQDLKWSVDIRTGWKPGKDYYEAH
jgi:hypothetical protein